MLPASRYALPRTAIIAWFTNDSIHLDTHIRLRLLAGPFSSGIALAAAGMSTLLICSVAVYRQPNVIFLTWLFVDLTIWILRWIYYHRCNSQSKPPLWYATDISLLLGLIWAAEIGAGTAACVISGDPVLQVLACTTAVSMNGAIAMRGQGVPRYAFAQVLLTDIPLKISTLFQPEPMLTVFILQAPMYLSGLWALLRHLNANLTKSYEAEARSSHLASHDSLTGLLNRPGILATLNCLLSRDRESRHDIALLYLDLDGFKSVNDSCGHMVGDQVLIHFSKLLSNNLRSGDFAARLGGDEFIILLLDDSVASIANTAERIIQTFKDYSSTSNLFKDLGVSVGIAVCEDSGLETSENLLNRADTALYLAKVAGKGCYRFG